MKNVTLVTSSTTQSEFGRWAMADCRTSVSLIISRNALKVCEFVTNDGSGLVYKAHNIQSQFSWASSCFWTAFLFLMLLAWGGQRQQLLSSNHDDGTMANTFSSVKTTTLKVMPAVFWVQMGFLRDFKNTQNITTNLCNSSSNRSRKDDWIVILAMVIVDASFNKHPNCNMRAVDTNDTRKAVWCLVQFTHFLALFSCWPSHNLRQHVGSNEPQLVPDGARVSTFSHVEPVCNGRLLVEVCHVPEQD